MQAGENTGNKKSNGWRGKKDGERRKKNLKVGTMKRLICTVGCHLGGFPVTLAAPDRHCALHF